jgi:hypothetical protein
MIVSGRKKLFAITSLVIYSTQITLYPKNEAKLTMVRKKIAKNESL